MTARPTVGIRLPNSGPFAAPASIRDLALLAEALGFDSVICHSLEMMHGMTHAYADAVLPRLDRDRARSGAQEANGW